MMSDYAHEQQSCFDKIVKKNSMFIDGIAISNFRSFGAEPQEIGPLGKVNVFVGQNNVGKSNILLFLKNYYPAIISSQQFSLPENDRHLSPDGKTSPQTKFGIGLTIDGENYKQKINEQRNASQSGNIIFFLSSKALTHDSGLAWFYYSGNLPQIALSLSQDFLTKIKDEQRLSLDEWRTLYHSLTGDPSGNRNIEDCIPEVIKRLSPMPGASPTVSLIPAIRQIMEGNINDYNGTSIYQRLAALQNPRLDRYAEDHPKFEQINEFVQNVTDNTSARIHVPYDSATIHVNMNGKLLSLSSLGTGLHEVILLATEATLRKDQVVCIEEPELHFHPILQKKLINYLSENTNNQYFITTHSNSFINVAGVDVFHVTYDGIKTEIRKAVSSMDKNFLLDDLGYHASDLLQANYVLWVEGPSDRIYIRNWIEKMDTRLKEGIHYSIMFYGGRLRSHLTVGENEIDEFIKLNMINRNVGIVQDSDRKEESHPIDKTKQRLIDGFTNMKYFNWITEGREIENYVSEKLFKDAFRNISGTELIEYGQYVKLTQYKEDGVKEPKTVGKVELAREITKQDPDWEVLDLKAKIEELVRKICEANNMKIENHSTT